MFPKTISYVLLFILALCNKASAQQVKATFRIIDRDSIPIPFAQIQVIGTPDSVTERFGDIADSTGRVAFTLTQGHRYIARVHAINYKPSIKNILIIGDHPAFVMVAETDTKSLKDVQITAKRPLLRQEDDKTIVDPEELAASSTNAYDIMEKIPGIYVDQDGSIYISSTTPATIYINGREQKMSNTDVASLLKSLPPNSIEKIEIMRTPSSKFDASSSGGIVNVVLKKGVHIGLTGNTNAGMNQGTYGNQFAGFTLNNSNGIFSTSFSLQASARATGEQLNTNRKFAPDSMLVQKAYTKYPGSTYYGSYSIGYTPDKKWDINYDGRISINQNSGNTNTASGMQRADVDTAFADFNTGLNNNTHNVNINQGLSARYKIDTQGSEWSADFSYNYLPSTTTQHYETDYTQPILPTVSGNGDLHSNYQYLSFKSDIVKKLPLKSQVEAGIKTTNVWFDNNTAYTITYRDTTKSDLLRSNIYNYDEHIYAAYAQASKNFAGILIKAGARLEHTEMNGHQIEPKDTSFKVNRTDLFPYVYISRKVMSIKGYELRGYLIYRRTISRPSYDYLNPFPKYVDQFLSEVGNPSLRPQFTKNYEANISVDERPLFAFGYNDMTDIFSQVVYPSATNPLQTYRTWDNLGRNREYYARGLGILPPGKTYFGLLGVQYNSSNYDGQYNGAPLTYKHESWMLFTYQTLKLSKLTMVVLNGFVRFKSQVQFYELSTFGSLNLSINHQFLQKKLKATLSVTDMFLTNNNQFTIDQGAIHATGLRKGDTRRFGFNVSYNFGVRKKEVKDFVEDATPQ